MPFVARSPGLKFLQRLALGAALSAGLASFPGGPQTLAWAQPAAKPDAAAKKKAAARFREAEALFQKHAYPEAAAAFEDAYNIAPHPSVMLNAINAWTLAGQPAQAATLATKLVADPAADEKAREDARSRLAELRGKIGRLEIQGAKARQLTVDGKSIAMGEVFVDPGDHLIEAEIGDKKIQRKVTVVAGSSERILLEAPAAAPPPPKSATAAPPPPPEPTVEKPRGLPPTVTYVGVGVTLALGGVLIWSGLDTQQARKDFDANPNRTEADKQAGLDKQLRTNVLLGATAVAGLATAGIALFATNWKGSSQATTSLHVGPGSLTLKGAF